MSTKYQNLEAGPYAFNQLWQIAYSDTSLIGKAILSLHTTIETMLRLFEEKRPHLQAECHYLRMCLASEKGRLILSKVAALDSIQPTR